MYDCLQSNRMYAIYVLSILPISKLYKFTQRYELSSAQSGDGDRTVITGKRHNTNIHWEILLILSSPGFFMVFC